MATADPSTKLFMITLWLWAALWAHSEHWNAALIDLDINLETRLDIELNMFEMGWI